MPVSQKSDELMDLLVAVCDIALNNDESDERVLRDLSNKLLSKNVEEKHHEICHRAIYSLCGIVQHSSSERVRLGVDVFSKLLNQLPASVFLQHVSDLNLSTLNTRDALVRCLVVSQAERCLTSQLFCDLLSQTELLRSLIYCIGSSDGSACESASACVQLLKRVCVFEHEAKDGQQKGWHRMLHEPLVSCLREMLALNDTVKYRVIELVLALASVCGDSLRRCVVTGMLAPLIHDVFGDDRLVQANALRLLPALSDTYDGVEYLCGESGVLLGLDQCLSGDCVQDIVFNGVMMCLAEICGRWPERVLTICPSFRRRALTLSPGHTQLDAQLVCIRCVTCMMRSSCGLRALLEYGDEMELLAGRLGELLQSSSPSPDEVKLCVLVCIHQILLVHNESKQSDIVSSGVERWMSLVLAAGSSQLPRAATLQLLFSLCRRPFQQVRLAAFYVLQHLAPSSWGQQLLANTPGLVEYLLDRRTETDIAGWRAKFDIICAVCDSASVGDAFNEVQLAQMRNYRRNGAVFVPSQSQVLSEQG